MDGSKLWPAVLALGTLACSEPYGPVELEHEQVLTAQIRLTRPDVAVDVLIVLDDSLSMAGEQANLAANFPAFVNVLEAPDVEADYRIAIITTDVGNPRCPTESADHGEFILTACTERLDDFVVGEVDTRAVACTDACTLTAEQLEILATTTERDPEAKPRPWLERIDGESNLPPGVSVGDALACFAPQGIAGCNFESPLESMYLALGRMVDAADPAYGFLRNDAHTLILFITDGHDCSHTEAGAAIFTAAGNHVFWSDPSASIPTSAVCWNAGMECVGDPSHYESCEVVDKGLDGGGAGSPDEAVLHPLARYIDRLEGFDAARRELGFDSAMIVATVAGATDNGGVYFADADDPGYQAEYGIGPGCTAPEGVDAVPPGRLFEFTEWFNDDQMFSVCSDDYSPAFEVVAWNGWGQLQPSCFPGCPEDSDPATSLLEPECTVELHPPDQPTEWLDECARNPDGSYAVVDYDYTMPSPDTNSCYAMLTDTGGLTIDPNDDVSDQCLDSNYPLEFKVARRQGFPIPGGTAIYASCLISDFSRFDCPYLGD